MAIKKQLAAGEHAVVQVRGAAGHQQGVQQGPPAVTPAAGTPGNTPWT